MKVHLVLRNTLFLFNTQHFLLISTFLNLKISLLRKDSEKVNFQYFKFLDKLKDFKHDGITIKGNSKLNSLVQQTYSEISLF